MGLLRSLQRRYWRIRPPVVDSSLIQTDSSKGTSTVSLDIAGQKLWFSSSQVQLSPNPLVFLTLFFPHHLAWKISLSLPHRISSGQSEALNHITTKFRNWWSFPHPLQINQTQEPPPPPITKERRRGAFFSCGADSFHTLLSNSGQIDDLILLHGFDVALEDQVRFNALKSNALSVANKLGKRLVVIRTNLRTHPVFQLVPWPISHGPALASVAHLLENELSTVSIAASYPRDYFQPWGSNAQTDPLWSSPNMQILHHGDDLWRTQKIALWGQHPLFQKHLAVCWEQRRQSVNCGECEKCLRTQLALLIHGHLDTNQSFHHPLPLALRMQQLPKNSQYTKVYQEFLNHPLPDEVRSAITSWLSKPN